MKTVLLEFADQLPMLEQHAASAGERLQDLHIVALEPAVQAALSARGIPYETPVQYFTNASHVAMIRETERAIAWLHQEFRFRDAEGIEHSYLTDVCHYVRTCLNLLYAQIEIVSNVAEAHRGTALIAFGDPGTSALPTFSTFDRPLGELVRRYAEASRCGASVLPAVEAPAPPRSSLLRRLGARWSAAALRALLESLRDRPIVLVQRRGRMFARLLPQLQAQYPDVAFVSIDHSIGAGSLLAANLLGVPSRPPNAAALVRGMRRDRYYSVNLEWLGAPVAAAQYALLDRALEQAFRPDAAPAFTYEGIDCSGIVRRKALDGLRSHLYRLLRASAALRLMLSRFDVRLVLSYSALGVMAVAAEAARLSGRPSLMVSHGAHPAPVDDVHELELRNQCRGFMLGEYSHAALCVPAHESHLAYFRARYPWVRTEGVRSGNLIFASVDRTKRAACRRHFGAAEGDLVLTHAVTLKPRGHTRYYYIETASECLESLRDLIRVVDGQPGIRLIIRPHPGIGLTAEELTRLLPASPRVTFSHAEPFGDVLSATDALISYSSTTIEEALMNAIPVILYDRHRRYNHGGTPANELGRSSAQPMIYAASPAELLAAVGYVRSRLRTPDGFDFERYRYSGEFDPYRAFLSGTLGTTRESGVA